MTSDTAIKFNQEQDILAVYVGLRQPLRLTEYLEVRSCLKVGVPV